MEKEMKQFKEGTDLDFGLWFAQFTYTSKPFDKLVTLFMTFISRHDLMDAWKKEYDTTTALQFGYMLENTEPVNWFSDSVFDKNKDINAEWINYLKLIKNAAKEYDCDIMYLGV